MLAKSQTINEMQKEAAFLISNLCHLISQLRDGLDDATTVSQIENICREICREIIALRAIEKVIKNSQPCKSQEVKVSEK
jgi:hypothetical protein